MPLPLLAIFAISAAAKLGTELLRPDSSKLYEDMPEFKDNPYLMNALRDAEARSKDPGVFEKSIQVSSRQLAPLIRQQYQAAKEAYGKNPALYSKASEQIAQNSGTLFSRIFDRAYQENEAAKAAAQQQVTSLASLQFQSESQKAQMLAQLKAEDQQRLYDTFGDLFGSGASVFANLYGQQTGMGSLPTQSSDITGVFH